MRVGMIPKFHANPLATHFMCNGCGSATSEKAVKDKVPGISSYEQYLFYQFFRFGSRKPFILIPFREKFLLLIFSLTIMTCFFQIYP